VYNPRTLRLLRKGLSDPAVPVVEEALRTLRGYNYRGGLDSLTRIFREATEDRVRLAALDGIGKVEGTPEVARILLEAARQETGEIREAALAKLVTLSGEEVVTMVRQARELEVGDGQEVFDRILRAVGGGGR
jgi:HEAT repeat protein